jgi:TonB-linked SusC/RagA family outer membrane protein
MLKKNPGDIALSPELNQTAGSPDRNNRQNKFLFSRIYSFETHKNMKNNLILSVNLKKTVKLLIAMKIVYLFCTLQIFAVTTYSQSQKITLHLDNTSVEDIFNKIEDETDYFFFYRSTDLEQLGKVDADYNDLPIADVLHDMLKDTDLSYRVVDKYIAIAPTGKLNQQSDLGMQADGYMVQEKIIKGVVRDEENQPMPGVSVSVKGTYRGVVSDMDGKYEIAATSQDVIIFTFLGYDSREESVGDRSEINVVMTFGVERLEDVVVTGYQTISRERAAGAVSILSAEELQRRPSTNVASALDGMFTGMRVYGSGGSQELTIRGLGTMTMGIADPLVVVDGFAVEDGLNSINPNDIQSIHVLKDASAASIWGARSSNGVIVITTKRAEKGMHVRVNSFVSIQDKMDLDYVNPIASSADALRWEKYLWDNDITFSSFSISSNVDGNNNPASLGITLLNLRDLGRISQSEFNQRWAALEQTDYRNDVYDYLLQNPVIQNYDISVNGASEKNQYVFNIRYTNEDEDFKHNSNKDILTNFRNIYSITPWLDFNFSIMSRFMRQDNSGASLSEIKSISPYERLVNNDGSFATMVGAHYQEFIDSVAGIFPKDWNYNLLQEIENRSLTMEQNNLRLQTSLNFKLFKGLTYETKFQWEQYKTENSSFYGEDSYYVRDQLNKWVDYDEPNREVLMLYVPVGGQLNKSYSSVKAFNFGNHLKYNQTVGDHQITAGLFTEISSRVGETFSAPTVYGYDPDMLTSVVPNVYYPIHSYWGATNYTLGGMESSMSYTDKRFFSLLGNGAYTFRGKYSLTGSFRIDASNIIVKDPKYRYAPFWSAGANWRADRETFIQDMSLFTRLNVRFSYGHTGNVVLSTSFVPLITMMGVYPPTGGEYAVINDYGNPTLTWERTKTTNIGIDFAFRNTSLSGTIELYNKHGIDIVGAIDLPRLTGTSLQEFNTAEILNRGVELSLNYGLPVTSDIKWSTRLNFSYNNSKVLSLQRVSYDYSGIRSPHFEEGKPVDAIYSYKYLGMNTDNVPVLQGIGDDTWTFNQVAPATSDDREYMIYSGSTQPTTMIGWQNLFSLYGFELSAYLTGEFGFVFRMPTFDYPILTNSKNTSTLNKDVVGVLDGTTTDIPTMPSDDETNLSAWGGYAQYLNTTIENASNIRLREVNLSYYLPDKILSKTGLTDLKVYCQIRNAGLIWVANQYGIDPLYILNSRSSGAAATPQLRAVPVYTFGLSFEF